MWHPLSQASFVSFGASSPGADVFSSHKSHSLIVQVHKRAKLNPRESGLYRT